MDFFTKVKNWWVAHGPSKRRLIQVYTMLLYNANLKGYLSGDIYKGKTKYACVPSINCYSCPGAVGSCPLGALQNALFSSNTHAAYYILGIIGLFGLLLARTICGWLCPVGLGQELLHKIKTPKLRKSKFTRVLSYLKYVLLVVLVLAIPLMYSIKSFALPGFCKFICPAGTFEGGLGLLLNPNNQTGSNNYLEMLGPIFTWKFAVLVAIIVASVFVFRPFCRFLCPLGAIYGFFNRIALIGVKLDKSKCTDCGLCIAHCKMDVRHVGDHECINCGECIKVCPTKAISWKGSQIFLRHNDAFDPVPTEKVNLTELATEPSGVATTFNVSPVTFSSDTGSEKPAFSDEVGSEKVDDETTINNMENVESTVDTGEKVDKIEVSSAETSEVGAEVDTSGEKAQNSDMGGEKPRRSKGFWFQFAAWMTAIVVLIGALCYFNIFAETAVVQDLNVGDDVPAFVLKMYGENENGNYALLDTEFTVQDHIGEVMVINFWATWCGPCVAEIPYFENIAREFPEVKVLAIHGDSTDDVPKFIITPRKGDKAKENWRDYKVIFLQDIVGAQTCEIYAAFGGKGPYPRTAIINKEGKVSYITPKSITEDELRTEVLKALSGETTEG